MRGLAALSLLILVACPEPIADRCGPSLPECPGGLVCVAGLCARVDGGAATAGAQPLAAGQGARQREEEPEGAQPQEAPLEVPSGEG